MRPAETRRKTNGTETQVEAGECRFLFGGQGRFVMHSLGADVAVAVDAPALGLAAVLRFADADSKKDPTYARENPWWYADTGLTLLLSTFEKCGANRRDLRIRALGAAQDQPAGSTGRANELALRKILWAKGLILGDADLGGAVTRSVCFEPSRDRLLVSSEKHAISIRHAALQRKAS